jgi:hypothetical protein
MPTETKDQEQTQTAPPPQPAAPLARVVATPVPARMGVAPSSVEEGWRLATMMAKSELVPKNFRGKAEDIIVAIQMGAEIGLPPMQALQSIAVINGRPSVWGDGFLALIMASAAYADHDEYYEVDGQRRDGLTAEDIKKDTTAGVCTFIRRGKASPITRRFTIAQAKKAGLLGKEGPWQSYPDRMLAMRARSWAGRDGFPDVLRGISTTEEALDTPPDIDVEAFQPREVKRISETPKPAETSADQIAAVPPATEVSLGPLAVSDVQQFMGGFTVTLGDGTKVDTTEMNEAAALEGFKGTSHKVRLVALKAADGNLQLKSFAIAD